MLIDAASGHRWPRAVAADLGAINSALARAQAEGVQFRLVVVADTAMNAMCWDHVREAGF